MERVHCTAAVDPSVRPATHMMMMMMMMMMQAAIK
jgi:hypothetical protein